MHNFCNSGDVAQTEQGIRRRLQEHELRVRLQSILDVLRVSCVYVRRGDAHSPGYLQTHVSHSATYVHAKTAALLQHFQIFLNNLHAIARFDVWISNKKLGSCFVFLYKAVYVMLERPRDIKSL